jgi:hypothetical protein
MKNQKKTLAVSTGWAALAATVVLGFAAAPAAWAKQGATDPIPGTSKGTVKSGGTTAPAPAPAPTPAPLPPPPVVSYYTSPLTFTASGPVNGVLPVCTGSYHVDPYYPTLSLMTVDVSASSLNVPDGTVCYVYVSGAGGTLYPFTSNAIVVTAGAGVCSHSEYITPGTTVTGVTIRDAAGNVVFVGK